MGKTLTVTAGDPGNAATVPSGGPRKGSMLLFTGGL